MRNSFVVLVALVLVLLGAAPASADPPVEVSDPVTDHARVLGADAAAVEGAIADLATDKDIHLYVVLVPSFDEEGSTDWIGQTAQLSELEGSDILLAVATRQDAYQYAWWVDESFPQSESAVQALIDREVAPELDAGNWGAAVVTMANGLRAQATTVAEEEAGAPSWSTSTTVLVVGGLSGVLLAGHLLSRRRRTPAVSAR